MGLDMYLSARRRFTVGSDEAEVILGLVNMSAAELEEITDNEDEGGLYLGRWNFMKKSNPDGYIRATAVQDAAGLLELGTEEAGDGLLRARNGALEVTHTCAYWRKANAVHAWFVDECQGGVDECQESEVHPEKLAELHMLCQKALSVYEAGDIEGAGALLTPRSGFFFGATDINEWWAEDLKHTITELERVINGAARIGRVDFIYRSSW